MLLNVVLFVLGAAWLQQQAELPSVLWTYALVPATLGWWLVPEVGRWQTIARRIAGAALCCAAGFLWAALVAHVKLADHLAPEWEGRDIVVRGAIAELPQATDRGMRFGFDVEQTVTPLAHVPRHITLTWYAEKEANAQESVPALHPGQRWQLIVRLRRPHALANPNGFDFDAWLLERGIRATGYIRADRSNRMLEPMVWRAGYVVERAREWVRKRILSALPENPAAGVLVALAIGDQQSISREEWTVFTRTGVNHLMSISGLHITMVSALGFSVVLWLWRRSPRLSARLAAVKAAAIAGLLVACAYAVLAGFAVPAQRTVYMLAAVAAGLLLGLASRPLAVLSLALLVAVVADPMCVLAPGFWLSFGAVAVIMYVSLGRLGPPHWLANWAHVQWAVTIGLAPFLVAMFQQISLVSPLANALAIPVVSLGVVPLTLAGVVLPVHWLLELAAWLMSLCTIGLQWMSTLPAAVWQQHAPPWWAVPLALLGALWVLAPRGFPGRWFGLIAFLPLLVVKADRPAPGEVWVDVLDVGQGLSTVVRTQHRALLYDAGPAYSSDTDAGSRVVVPFLRAHGVQRLDGFIVTHDDIDHSGGAASVLEAVPVDWVATSLPEDSAALALAKRRLRCFAGQSWEWDGVRFAILHPEWRSYNRIELKDNARGCVLKIESAFGSVLLPADIEQDSEADLLRTQREALRADVLVAPHHGSSTSSTLVFLTQVGPGLVVIPVGYRNRFGHPKPEVVERYEALGSRILRSDRDGAVSLRLTATGLTAQGYRAQYRRYWQDR
ncbi:MAG TPA: DNA internalization-related competence protein ComEC/Rec2 [Burkholderiales bacterium]|nr:DNA internalization-related competence protein ComEC/Rec2 [Burkholderiales bacterium]